MFNRNARPTGCANCRRAVPARPYENGRDYCPPCGDRLELTMHIWPLRTRRPEPSMARFNAFSPFAHRLPRHAIGWGSVAAS